MWPQWTNMLGAGSWAVLALVPPAIIALYFLKLRRQPRVVPSTYLWSRSLEDLHVNSLWQKLRQSLLLFMQLAIVLLVILALLRPAWRGSRLAGDRFVFLVDNSASMSAADVPPSRLDEAKRRTLELIDRMPSGAAAMIVSFADRARVESPFTTNKKELRRALAGIEITNRSTALDEALRVASGLANPGRSGTEAQDVQVAEAMPATLYILSDGRFPDVQGFALGNLEPHYLPIGADRAKNLGIVAFSTRRNDETDAIEAFARIENAGLESAQVEIELHAGEELLDAQRATIAEGESAAVVFELGAVDHPRLELRLPDDDALAADNRAWAVVEPPRRARVLLVTPGNEPLAFALATERASEMAVVDSREPAFLESPEYQQAASTGAYQLAIFDRCAPKLPPQANALYIGSLPPGGVWSRGEEFSPQIIDADAAHPLLHLLEMWNVDIVTGHALTLPAGGTALLQAQTGPLAGVAPREAFQDVVLGFEIVSADGANTNWPLRVSFPLFVLNALGYLAAGDQQAGMAIAPGRSIQWAASPGVKSADVTMPNGTSRRVSRGNLEGFEFGETEQLGIYSIAQPPEPQRHFAVNLFDPDETKILPRPENSIHIGYVEVAGTPARESVPREAWKWLISAGLFVLLLEWYIYNRRVFL